MVKEIKVPSAGKPFKNNAALCRYGENGTGFTKRVY